MLHLSRGVPSFQYLNIHKSDSKTRTVTFLFIFIHLEVGIAAARSLIATKIYISGTCTIFLIYFEKEKPTKLEASNSFQRRLP